MTSKTRVTLTHEDFNVLLDALDGLDEEIKNWQGALDPYRLEVIALSEKLQEARKRLK